MSEPLKFTVEAFQDRTGLRCSNLSFKGIADGRLPPVSARVAGTTPFTEPTNTIVESGSEGPKTSVDMVICSFALHLLGSTSELFALLYELSTKAKWLVVLAPHKKPEVGMVIHRSFFCLTTQLADQRWLGVVEMERRFLVKVQLDRPCRRDIGRKVDFLISSVG